MVPMRARSARSRRAASPSSASPEHAHAALAGRERGVDEPEQGGLAGPARPQDRHPLSRADRQRHRRESAERAEDASGLLELDDRAAAGGSRFTVGVEAGIGAGRGELMDRRFVTRRRRGAIAPRCAGARRIVNPPHARRRGGSGRSGRPRGRAPRPRRRRGGLRGARRAARRAPRARAPGGQPARHLPPAAGGGRRGPGRARACRRRAGGGEGLAGARGRPAAHGALQAGRLRPSARERRRGSAHAGALARRGPGGGRPVPPLRLGRGAGGGEAHGRAPAHHHG